MKQKGLLGFLCFIVSLVAQGGVYMGTASNMPQEYTTSDSSVASLQEVPYVDAPAAQGLLQGCEPYSGKGPMPATPCPGMALTPPEAYNPLVVTVREGSLKENIERIVKQAGWGTPVWKPPFDYNWVGNVTISANDIQGILTKLLEPYPLQAVFYEANHVVAIVPRRNV